MGRILQALLLIGLLFLIAFAALFWFDFMDIIDSRVLRSSILGFFGVSSDISNNIPAPVVLDNVRLQLDQEAIRLREEALAQRINEIEERETQLKLEEEALRLQKENLADREKTLNEKITLYDNRSGVLEKNAQDLMNMPPAEAVEILVNYDDQLLIDVLAAADAITNRLGEQSLVPYWLSLLPAERAAVIQRKMTLKIGE